MEYCGEWKNGSHFVLSTARRHLSNHREAFESTKWLPRKHLLQAFKRRMAVSAYYGTKAALEENWRYQPAENSFEIQWRVSEFRERTDSEIILSGRITVRLVVFDSRLNTSKHAALHIISPGWQKPLESSRDHCRFIEILGIKRIRHWSFLSPAFGIVCRFSDWNGWVFCTDIRE